MNIAMMTNNYLPHIGGVSRSVVTFSDQYRSRGHNVLIVAPYIKDQHAERHLVSVPAFQGEITRGMGVPLPIPGIVSSALKDFEPDIIHSHHPFMLGNTAFLSAVRFNVPLVFTHHTMYEHYTHYAPADSIQIKQLVKDISTGYANLCDCVFVPTPSIASVIRQRGVTSRIEVMPTGINTKKYRNGSGSDILQSFKIPPDAFVVGHVGRLSREKNLFFMMDALTRFLAGNIQAHAIIVGDGLLKPELQDIARKASLDKRIHFTGALQNQEIIDAYHAMNLFAFTSLSETQGLVLLEALAAGIPIVALDAPGARDIVMHGLNGWLVREHDAHMYSDALHAAHRLLRQGADKYRNAAWRSVVAYEESRCADAALIVYDSLIAARKTVTLSNDQDILNSPWLTAQRLMTAEWKLWSNRLSAVYSAIQAA